MIKLAKVAPVAGAVFCLSAFYSAQLEAASCCGGGSSSSLVLPKFSQAMVDASFDYEVYKGFWNQDGDWTQDPKGSDLKQYRLNLGYAHRLAPRWQASASLPYVWNQNKYASMSRNTSGIGDAAVSMWYEAFDKVSCVWEVNSWQDLKPAVYWGGSLTVPTGTSPYDDVQDNFDTTGRGFYRLDLSMLMDKTVYPWNASFQVTYGKHLQRSVNREYGTYVDPYRKQLGDRFNSSLSFGYTYFTDAMESLTGTLAYAYLKEGKGTIDGDTDPNSGMEKRSLAASVAWATEDRDWVTKFTLSHAPTNDGWGRNFPATNVFTVGATHVLR